MLRLGLCLGLSLFPSFLALPFAFRLRIAASWLPFSGMWKNALGVLDWYTWPSEKVATAKPEGPSLRSTASSGTPGWVLMAVIVFMLTEINAFIGCLGGFVPGLESASRSTNGTLCEELEEETST